MIMVSAKSMPLDRLNQIDVASTIYDVNNRPGAKLGSTNKEYVQLKDVRSRKLIEECLCGRGRPPILPT